MNPIFQTAIRRALRRRRGASKKHEYSQAELGLYILSLQESLPGYKKLLRWGLRGMAITALLALILALAALIEAGNLGWLAGYLSCIFLAGLFILIGITVYAWQSILAIESELRQANFSQDSTAPPPG